MAVPKQRKTKSRRNQRRMHIHLKTPSLVVCSKCKEKKVMHTVCGACGFYKDREVVDVLKKAKIETSKEKADKVKKEEDKALTMEALSKDKKDK